MKGWTPQAIEKANDLASMPTTPRTPVSSTKEPSPPPASPQRPAFAASASGPETHLVGPYALSLADPKHYPGRSRYVLTGPADPALTAALVAALHSFTTTP